jgi:molybdopterin/thiamine biosynthesis adenylyltransferase
MTMTNEYLSRERLVGYDPARVRSSRFLVVGAGAIGQNVVQSLALVGVGVIRSIDFDRAEGSNRTKSPFLRESDEGLFKAEIVARRAREISTNPAIDLEFATVHMEDLGLASFEGVSVVLSAVDSLAARAWLSDRASLLGLPFVEGGFDGLRAHRTTLANRRAETPCFRCLFPDNAVGREPCSLYAKAVIESERLPATQSVAAVTANLMVEAAIMLAHGDESDADRYVEIDIRSGQSFRTNIVRGASCRAPHRRLLDVARAVSLDAMVRDVLNEVDGFRSPFVRFLEPRLVSAPCARCGGEVQVGAPFESADTPVHKVCPAIATPSIVEIVSRIDSTDAAAERTFRSLGFAARDLVEISDDDGHVAVLRLDAVGETMFTHVVGHASSSRVERES